MTGVDQDVERVNPNSALLARREARQALISTSSGKIDKEKLIDRLEERADAARSAAQNAADEQNLIGFAQAEGAHATLSCLVWELRFGKFDHATPSEQKEAAE